MAKYLDVPPELLHLIEKRDRADRRYGQRRRKPSADDSGSAYEPIQDKRQNKDRRKKSRRTK